MLLFVGGKGTFDHLHGPLFIDENFANIRGPGEAIGIHSGNPEGLQRNHYRYQNGKFHLFTGKYSSCTNKYWSR